MSEKCPECRRPSVSPFEMMTDEQWEAGPDSVCHARSTLHRRQDARHKCLELAVAQMRAELAEARKPRWEIAHECLRLGGVLVEIDWAYQKWCIGAREYDTLAEAKAAAEAALGVKP